MDSKRIDAIKQDLGKIDAKSRADMEFLLATIEQLEKKNEVLSAHVMELTQEMENVRTDFGSER